MATKKLVIANWKMNPTTIGEAKKLFVDTRKTATRLTRVETIIASPFPYIAELRKLSVGKRTLLAAQDAFYEKNGAYTGEVSPHMLKSLGVSHVIIGHSEQRELGDTDDDINKKIKACLRAELKVVLCVGERERDSAGKYLGFVEDELRNAFSGVTKKYLKNVVVAYEPIWAISTEKAGHVATPEDAHEMRIFIQKVLAHIYDRASALKIPVLYGGSVNAQNSEELIMRSECDGFLVGGASLKAKEFGTVLKNVNAHG